VRRSSSADTPPSKRWRVSDSDCSRVSSVSRVIFSSAASACSAISALATLATSAVRTACWLDCAASTWAAAALLRPRRRPNTSSS
jgi:hypothetical protein